jgi:hypothetical protein
MTAKYSGKIVWRGAGAEPDATKFSGMIGHDLEDNIYYHSNGTTWLPSATWADDTGTALVRPDGTEVSLQGGMVSGTEKLNGWRAAVSRARFRQANILIIGNSITEGFYANDTVATNLPVFRERGMCAQLRYLISEHYGGDPGQGIVLCTDTRVVGAGGATLYGSLGISAAGGYRISNTGQTVTLTTTEACTDIWIHGWWEDSRCEAFIYTVDGGGDQTSPFAGPATDTDFTVKLTGLSNTTHTIVIKPAATPTAQVDIAGFSIFNAGTTSKVAVHRIGQGGAYFDSMIYPMTDTGANPRSNRLTLGRPVTDLCVLAFGANEASTAGEAASWTPARYETALRDFIGYAAGTYGCDVLLASLNRQNPSQVGSYGEQAFYDVHAEIAADTARVAHFDLTIAPQWASYAAASAAGLMQDNVHPNHAGHADIGRLLYRALFLDL